MAPVTITSWALCRKAILPPGTSRMKWRFSSRSACTLIQSALDVRGGANPHIHAVSERHTYGPADGSARNGQSGSGAWALWVVEWRLDAELRRVAGAGGWKDCEYHSVFISRKVGLRYRCPLSLDLRIGGGYVARRREVAVLIPAAVAISSPFCRRPFANTNRLNMTGEPHHGRRQHRTNPHQRLPPTSHSP